MEGRPSASEVRRRWGRQREISARAEWRAFITYRLVVAGRRAGFCLRNSWERSIGVPMFFSGTVYPAMFLFRFSSDYLHRLPTNPSFYFYYLSIICLSRLSINVATLLPSLYVNPIVHLYYLLIHLYI